MIPAQTSSAAVGHGMLASNGSLSASMRGLPEISSAFPSRQMAKQASWRTALPITRASTSSVALSGSRKFLLTREWMWRPRSGRDAQRRPASYAPNTSAARASHSAQLMPGDVIAPASGAAR